MTKNKYFRSSDPYLLHLGGKTYILKALLIYFLLLMISYDKMTLNMCNVRKCLYLYPVFENKLKKIGVKFDNIWQNYLPYSTSACFFLQILN